MLRRSIRHLAVVLATLALALGLGACQPTGNPRCDQLAAQIARAEALGYRIRCDAPFPGEASDGRQVLGWTDHDTHTIWMWPARLPDPRALRKVAWHEVGHAVWERHGWSGAQADEERWADGFAYCAEPIQGVGYLVRPADCRGYR